MTRSASISRKTKETDISIQLVLPTARDPGPMQSFRIDTGIGFLDHMIHALAKHAGWSITVECKGDIHVDDHHTVEDIAIVLGMCFNKALTDPKDGIIGITRFGFASVPLDEALVQASVDISGRPGCFCDFKVKFASPYLGTMNSQMIKHFFLSFSNGAKLTLHLDFLKGENDHHLAEAAFKALAVALRAAIQPYGTECPSTKGSL